MKNCVLCKEEKSLLDFYKNKKSEDGFDTTCKTCRKKIYKKWYNSEKGQKKIRNYSKEYYKRPGIKQSQRIKRLEKTYNISYSEYEKILKKQKGLCAICGNKEIDPRHSFLSVDHDHSTGKVRGLLCNLCNKGIGLFKDNISLLQKAIDYIVIYKP